MESDGEVVEENGKQQQAVVKAKRRALKAAAKKVIAPTEGATAEGETRAERRAKRRALRSSLVEELRAEMGQTPECVADRQQTNANRRRAEAQRRFEEAHFVRLSGAERKRRRLGKANADDGSDLGHLLDFGRYRLRNDQTSEEKTSDHSKFRAKKWKKWPKRNGKTQRKKAKWGKRKGKSAHRKM